MRTARWVVVALTFLSASVAAAQDAPKGDDFEKLSSAIKFGGEPNLKAALDAGANPKAANPRGWTALHVAATLLDRDCMALLLDRGADVDAADDSGITPMFQVLRRKRYDLVRLLIEKGSDPGSALYEGAEQGDLELMRFAISKGAKAVPLGAKGSSPLHKAAAGGSVAAIDLLLEAGADPNATDRDDRTPLRFAAAAGRTEAVVRLLKAGAKADIGTPPSLVVLAASNGHVEAAKALAEAGAKLDVFGAAGTGRRDDLAAILAKDPSAAKARLPEGDTPLHFAARSGSAAVVDLLLASGADLKALDRGQALPFHRSSTPEVADAFLAKGISINVPRGEKSPDTLLTIALDDHRSALALHLLQKGATFDKKGPVEEGSSALHAAARAGDLAAVRWMVEHGAEVDLGTRTEFTPLHTACSAGFDDVAKWLVEHGANANRAPVPTPDTFSFGAVEPTTNALGLSILARRTELALWLLSHGADPSGGRGVGLPPLSTAATAGDLAIAKVLLEKGAPVDARDSWQRTALHRAAADGRDDVAAFLLEHGADKKATDLKGKTAAALATENRHFKLAERLR